MSLPTDLPEPVVWRGYTQAELDRQYNSRGTVPDVQPYLRSYATRTAEAKIALHCIENLRYGEGADERLDVYPARNPGAPVLVFLHGGDWRALSKEESGFAAPAYVRAGAMFVALDFTRVPAATLPSMGAQVRRALQWLWHHVEAYGGDPHRMHIAGHSSGANLVGQLLMTDWPRDFGMPADVVKTAVFMSGLGDLEPVRLSFRNAKLGLTPEVVQETSLLRRGALARCPLLVAVGSEETADYQVQSREVLQLWKSRGCAGELFELAQRHHFDAVLEWADPDSALHRAHGALMGLDGDVTKTGPPVWRGMDQAGLDAAYNQAAYAENQQQVLQRYARGSDAARRVLGEPRRFAYGGGPVETLDVYPTDQPNAPVLVFIHGGAWRSGQARQYGFFAELFVRAGVHVVVPDFAAVQDVDGNLLVMAEQLQRAIAWVHRNAGLFGGDARRMHVIGHSSGAHLAAVMLCTDWVGRFGLPADLLKSGICCSGIFDLKPCRLSARSSYVVFTDEIEQTLSPQRHIDRLNAPLVVAYGTLETPEFQRQSRDFAARVAAHGKPVDLLVAQGYNHFEILETLASPDGLLGLAALKQMGIVPA